MFKGLLSKQTYLDLPFSEAGFQSTFHQWDDSRRVINLPGDQFGCFLKWGYPKCWMVYQGKSYWNGWFRGTPIHGNLRLKVALLDIYGSTDWKHIYSPAKNLLFFAYLRLAMTFDDPSFCDWWNVYRSIGIVIEILQWWANIYRQLGVANSLWEFQPSLHM